MTYAFAKEKVLIEWRHVYNHALHQKVKQTLWDMLMVNFPVFNRVNVNIEPLSVSVVLWNDDITLVFTGSPVCCHLVKTVSL